MLLSRFDYLTLRKPLGFRDREEFQYLRGILGVCILHFLEVGVGVWILGFGCRERLLTISRIRNTSAN